MSEISEVKENYCGKEKKNQRSLINNYEKNEKNCNLLIANY